MTIGQFSLFVDLLQLVTESARFIGTFLAPLRQAEVSAQRKVELMRGANWRHLTEGVGLEQAIPADPPSETGR